MVVDSKGRKVFGVAVSIGPEGAVLTAVIEGPGGELVMGERVLPDGTIVDENGERLGHVDELAARFCGKDGRDGDDVIGSPLSAEYLN